MSTEAYSPQSSPQSSPKLSPKSIHNPPTPRRSTKPIRKHASPRPSSSSRSRQPPRPPPRQNHNRSYKPKPTRAQTLTNILSDLDDLGILLFFALPIYLGRRKTVYVLDDLGIFLVCRPMGYMHRLGERVLRRGMRE